MVDVILAATLGVFLDEFLRLALGADEQDVAAGGGDVVYRLQARCDQRHGLLQVDDVDPVAHPEEDMVHLGVPAAGIVADSGGRLR